MKKIYSIFVVLLTGLVLFVGSPSATQDGQFINKNDGASAFIRLKIQNSNSVGWAGIVLVAGSDTSYIYENQAGLLTINGVTISNNRVSNSALFLGKDTTAGSGIATGTMLNNLISIGDTTVSATAGRIVFKTSNTHFY